MRRLLARRPGSLSPRGASALRLVLRLLGATGALLTLAGCPESGVTSPDASTLGTRDGGSRGGEGGAGGTGGRGGGGSLGGGGGTDAAFEACVAALTPVCRAQEMDTAETIQTPCKSTEGIRIPLTAGGAHGPVTIQGGPYGAKIDWNQGAGTAYVNDVNLGEWVCNPLGIDTFQEPDAVSSDLKNTRDLDASLYTIFRPACMRAGEKYPVITWANGTCGYTHGYAILLGTLASHGFVVVASNSTWTATAPTDGVQLRALDYAKALDEDPRSVLYRRLDLERVGAMGHSQGAKATATAAADARIRAAIFWNTGTSSNKPFLDISADQDVGSPTASSLQTAVDGETKPGAWVFFHQVLQTGGLSTGHLVLMEQPERVWELAVAWWQWQLSGNTTAKKMFVGADCGLCNRDSELEYGANSMLQ